MGWERVTELADACLSLAKNAGRNAWVGVLAREGLDRAAHGSRIPWEIRALLEEGVIEVLSSRTDPFGSQKRTGEVLG
jgi:hypothetical protein